MRKRIYEDTSIRAPMGRAGIMVALLALSSVVISVLVPDSAEAYTAHAPISIANNAEFIPANGVTGGSGTPADPFVISGWEINASVEDGIRITGTDAHVVIRDVRVSESGSNFDAVLLWFTANTSVENVTISSAGGGLDIWASTNASVANNYVNAPNLPGIWLLGSTNVRVENNSVTDSAFGIDIGSSTNVTVFNNILTRDGLFIYGTTLPHFNSHSITPDNTVNGRPIAYYKDCADLVVDRALIGELIMTNCTRASVSNLTLADADVGIELAYVDHSTLVNNTVTGSRLGILLTFATNVSISAQAVTSNTYGIELRSSAWCSVYNNTLLGNWYGMELSDSSNVSVYHNNFIASVSSSIDLRGVQNSWDSGYVEGGNFWSDYFGGDLFSGPAQDQPGSDGIGDTPYLMNENASDMYPLMLQNGWLLPTVSVAWPASGNSFLTTPIVVSGTARDAGGVSPRLVEFRLNGGPWQAATGTFSWSASVGLILGSNSIDVRAWGIRGRPSDIATVNATYALPRPPGQPSALGASGGDRNITLIWSPPSDEGTAPISNYTVYRGTASGAETLLAEIGNVTTYFDAGLTNGRAYYYKVGAKNAAGEGPASEENGTTPLTFPTAPRNPQAVVGDGTVTITWEAPAADGGFAITGYRIFRGTSGGSAAFFADVGNVTAYRDTNVTNGETYYYTVGARTGVGEGPLSIEVTAKPIAPPAIPLPTQSGFWILVILSAIVVMVCALLLFLSRRRRRQAQDASVQALDKVQ